MTLENLLRTGQLKVHAADERELQRLLDSAQLALKDAAVAELSGDSRLNLAYRGAPGSKPVASAARTTPVRRRWRTLCQPGLALMNDRFPKWEPSVKLAAAIAGHG
jgi:hypothetical protein